jgi:hypothetical protein
MDEAIKKLLERLDENGFASVKVKDGHVIAISKDRLLALLKTANDSGKDNVIVFLKDPSKTN